jgi:hypothetical protein
MERPMDRGVRATTLARWGRTACAAVAVATVVPGQARDGVVGISDSARVAGRELRLNGSGVGMRVIFKVYAMGLYVVERKRTAAEVMESSEPRRLAMVLLRDVSGEDFSKLVLEYAREHHKSLSARAAAGLVQLGRAVTDDPNGLRKGDLLTMDWVPGTGVVVELNRRALIEPLKDEAFYNLLLGVWLGEKPADPALKNKLLGEPEAGRAAL